MKYRKWGEYSTFGATYAAQKIAEKLGVTSPEMVHDLIRLIDRESGLLYLLGVLEDLAEVAEARYPVNEARSALLQVSGWDQKGGKLDPERPRDDLPYSTPTEGPLGEKMIGRYS